MNKWMCKRNYFESWFDCFQFLHTINSHISYLVQKHVPIYANPNSRTSPVECEMIVQLIAFRVSRMSSFCAQNRIHFEPMKNMFTSSKWTRFRVQFSQITQLVQSCRTSIGRWKRIYCQLNNKLTDSKHSKLDEYLPQTYRSIRSAYRSECRTSHTLWDRSLAKPVSQIGWSFVFNHEHQI